MEEYQTPDQAAAYEAARLNALNRYHILDTPPEEAFNDLARLACQIFNLPICLISFIGEGDVFYKANVGLGNETSEQRSTSICTDTMYKKSVSVVDNVFDIPHLKDNKFGIRFYAGAPLITSDGYSIGVICMLNHGPVVFDEHQQEILSGLAKVVLDRVELRLVAINEEKLKQDHEQLLHTTDEMSAEKDQLVEFKEQVTRANTILENRQENFESLFDEAPVAIGICSVPDKMIRRANAALLDVWGEDHSIIGRPLEEVVPVLDDQTFLGMLDQVHATGKPLQAREIKLYIWTDDRVKSIYANVSLQTIERPSDQTAHIIFMIADVTEQVVAKQMVEEANIVLNSAIDAAGMGYTVVEFATGKMVSNDQFKKNYGYASHEEFYYADLFEAMLPKYRQKIKESVQDAIVNNTVYEAEYEVKWGDGTIHWIRAYGKPRYDIHGRASHIIGLNRILNKK